MHPLRIGTTVLAFGLSAYAVAGVLGSAGAGGSEAGSVQTTPEPAAFSTPAAPADAASVGAARPDAALPLSDIVYFGAAWPSLELDGPNPAFVLGAGYRNANVVRDGTDNVFFAGIVEKADAVGRVTDVILSFAGAHSSSADDALAGGALILGTDDPETQRAKGLLDQIIADPRYAHAHVYLTGHSLGGAISTWLFGYALATYGAAVTHDRISAPVFAAPPWGNGARTQFELTEADFGNYVQDYAAENDPIQSLGVWKLGVGHLLAPYQPFDFGVGAVNSVGNFGATMGHHPLAVVLGLHLPLWLSASQQDAILNFLASGGPAVNPGGLLNGNQTELLNPLDRTYGANGTVAQKITGTPADDTIFGSDSGDTILGGGGADTLTGGTGADQFVYRADDSTAATTDLIRDFSSAQGDRIDLHQIDAVAGNLLPDRFRFIGRSMPGAAGELGYIWSGGDTFVIARVGGSVPDLVIRLAGRANLTASDFLL